MVLKLVGKPEPQRRQKMKARAGVEFSFCIRDGETKQCCFCDNEQRDRCEAIANFGNRYCDDPRYAQVEGEIEEPPRMDMA